MEMRNLICRFLIVSAVSGVVSAFAGVAANAQSFTALYNFTGAAGSQASAPVTSGVPTGVTFGDIVRGSDLKPNAGANSINSTSLQASEGFNTTTLDPNGYLGFTVTPTAGEALTLTNISFTDQRSSTGPTTFELRSSLDGFTTDLGSYSYTTATTTGSQSFNFSGLQALTTPITFELFAYNASGSTGTYRLTSSSATTGFTVSGSLAPVTNGATAPEPGALALLGAGLLPIGAVVRRRISRKA